MARATSDEVARQLHEAGLDEFIRDVVLEPASIRGVLGMRGVVQLRDDPRFAEGGLHALHADVGTPRTEFRSYRGCCGPGSLQIVVNLQSGAFYADVDAWNPYADAVNWLGHAFGEVIPNWLTRKRRTDDVRTDA